uniref:p9 protein n=1 Tax=Cucurbit yellow stunting disorder virus TaxID=51330 RepID=Q8QMD6_9CLOS|nr:p9 protein [Cucurbit yellow stunting disorder virus]
MDLTTVIDKFGVEKVEVYLKLYNQIRMERGGVSNFLLRLIDTKVKKFLDHDTKMDYNDEETIELLQCLSSFVNMIPSYY